MEVVNVAKLIVVNQDINKLLLIHRSASDQRRPEQWDIPGGIVETVEQLEHAALRECMEETGVNISSDSIKLVYTDRHYFHDGDAKLVNWLIFYGLSSQADVTLSFEHDLYRWTSAVEAVSLLEYERYKNAIAFLAKHHVIQVD
jgi:8-oxo-dGTP pyrophosphatase MutT (NUDIX family)